MVTTLVFLVLAALFVAYANGANDNFKGVATLYGSGTLEYRGALLLATVATFLGSLAALYVGGSLISSFSGRGLVPDTVVADPAFLSAVGFGGALTVLLATRLGFPVSTTHALVGALIGAGIIEAGAAVNLGRLSSMFLMPLLISPIIASALASAQYPTFSALRRRLGITRETCVCAGEELVPVATLGGTATAARVTTLTLDTTPKCIERYQGAVVGVDATTLLNGLHYASAAAVSFARGVNDTPKIVALLLAAHLVAPRHAFVLVGIAIALGGLLGARRVAETMSHKITPMNPGQAFTGNLVTALLVLFASRLGLPVSTTHVACGALGGIGAVNRQAHWSTIGQILLAWVTTLPLAAALAAATALVLAVR
ncbi:MAG: anion permease [Candidatus Binatia bacterium]